MDISTNSADSFLCGSDDESGVRAPRQQRGMKPKRRGSMNQSDVFANSQMTSFRVSRRSQVMSPEELMPISRKHSTARRNSMGSRNNEAMRSISTDGFEESATTLILEDMRPERNHDDDLLASQSFPGSEKNSKRQLSPNDSWITDSSRVVGGEFAVLVEEHDSTEEEDILLWGWTLKFFRGLAVFRVSCGNFVNSMPVQVIMSILLVANAVILGVLTFDLPELTISILNVTDLVMLCAFTVEITLHAVYMGPRQLLRDFWLSFDFVVILFSWCFRGSSLAVLRSFRIFRVFSIVSRWESLRTLFEAIGSIIPKMASIWLSLLLFFYVFCVLFTNVWSGLYDEGYLDQNYFGNLGQTFVTLFQVMTLDSWAEVARQVMVKEPWGFLGFFVFILFTSFFIVNLVVAVICESLIQISRKPDESEDVSTMSLKDDDNDAGASGNASLEVMMRQMLKNQDEMAASIRELREEVKVLKRQRPPLHSLSTAPPPLSVVVSSVAVKEPPIEPAQSIENDVVDSKEAQRGVDVPVPQRPAKSHALEYQVSLEGSVLCRETLQVERKDSSELDVPRDYVAMLRDDVS